MSFSAPPSLEDIEVMAEEILESLPEELAQFCEGLVIRVEDLPDEATEMEMDLGDPFELPALYRSGKEIAPGIEKKTANDDDVLIIYRRSILDLWCETGEDLAACIRQAMIDELGRNFDFSDIEIEEMAARHYQGML